MSENLFCEGQKSASPTYGDGYYRTFKTPPPLSVHVKKMLDEYVENEDYNKALLFFMEYCDCDYDYSLFLIRELINGNYG